MESATWCRTPAAASAARRLRPEVSKNSSTALSSNEGELARSITTCVPAMASLSPSPVMVFTPVLGEAATTSWPPWRRMATVFEPIRPVPPMTTIFMAYPPLSMTDALGVRPRTLSVGAAYVICRRRPHDRRTLITGYSGLFATVWSASAWQGRYTVQCPARDHGAEPLTFLICGTEMRAGPDPALGTFAGQCSEGREVPRRRRTE